MKKQTFESEITKFRELFRIGISALKEAAQVYVKALDKNIAAKEAFRLAIPEITHMTWATFEKIGRGQLHEKLLFGGGKAQASLKNLSITEQTEALEHGVKLLLHDGTVMSIMPENFTASQVAQVFGNGHIRDLEAQRAWMESRRSYKLPVASCRMDNVRVEGNRLVIFAPVTLSKSELKKLIAQMEAAS